jgi:hypothetical protein
MELALRTEVPAFSLRKETRKIIHSESQGERSTIAGILRTFNVDPKLLPVLKARSKRPLIFSCSHNVDTLDGIARGHNILFPKDVQPRELAAQVVRILYRYSSGDLQELDAEAVLTLDSFWMLKNRVYAQGVYDPRKVLFERILAYYLFDLCRQRGILDRLTEYADITLLHLFPKLDEKIDGLWKFIRLSCYFSKAENQEEYAGTLTCNQNDSIPQERGEILKLLITTRQFLINKRAIPTITSSRSRNQRYCVKPSKTILFVRPAIIEAVEDILEYPLLRQRFPHIATETADYLV